MPDSVRQVNAPRTGGIHWKTLVLGLIVGVAGVAIVAGLVGLTGLLSHKNNLPLETTMGSVAIDLTSKLQAGSAQNPLGNNPRAAETGRQAFTGSCSVCHGANGDGKGMLGPGMYPQASDLRSTVTQSKSDAQLFWIVKNGLSFVGMPAFGSIYNDQNIWTLVSYVRSLGTGAVSQSSRDQVPAATADQLAFADPRSNTPAQRGAAVYFAQGCGLCHGPVGNAPRISLDGSARSVQRSVRRGENGMPSYGPDVITDAQLADMEAYVATFGR